MIESWVLIEEKNVNKDTLRSLSLANAKQLVVGSVPDSGVILHVAANSPADLGNALLEFAQVPNVTGVFALALRTRR
jgi:hypothetical protein